MVISLTCNTSFKNAQNKKEAMSSVYLPVADLQCVYKKKEEEQMQMYPSQSNNQVKQ